MARSTQMLPNDRPKATREEIGQWAGTQLSPEQVKALAAQVKVIAVRGYYLRTMGYAHENDRGIYDDAFFILTPEGMTAYNGNADPSRYREGIASLQSPQIIRYRPGYHGYSSKWGHHAFRQAGPVTVKRDGHTGHGQPLGDGLFHDPFHGQPANKIFWTNLHRGGHTTTSSAGCLTIPPNQWQAFYHQLRVALQRYQQDTFPLALIDEPRLADKQKTSSD